MAYSQGDSTKQKLQYYKSMYSDSLISEQEYIKLKDGLLFSQNEPKTFKTDLNFNRKANGQIIAGSLLLGSGIGAIIGGVYYKKHKIPFQKTDGAGNAIGNYTSDYNRYKIVYISTITVGSLSTVVGVILDIVGIKNKTTYLNNKKTVSLGLPSENIGLALNF